MELLDIRTADGKVTGIVKERTRVHRDGDIHGTSHVWLIRKNKKGKWEILLQKRSAHKDSFPDCYDISSAGHIPAGEDYLASAIRELKEELGVEADPEELQYVGMHDAEIHTVFYQKPWNNHELSAVYVLMRDLEPSGMKLQEEEVQEVRWMEFDACKKEILDGSLKHCIFEDEMEMLEQYLAELA